MPIPTLQAGRDNARPRHPDGVCVRPPQERPYFSPREAAPYQAGETRSVRTGSVLKRKEQEGKANEASILQVN